MGSGDVVVSRIRRDSDAVRPEQLRGVEADAMIALDAGTVRPKVNDRYVVVTLGRDKEQIGGWWLVIGGW